MFTFADILCFRRQMAKLPLVATAESSSSHDQQPSRHNPYDSPISNLPPEILHTILLEAILSSYNFKSSWNSWLLVNRAWSQTALWLQFVRISLRNGKEVEQMVVRIKSSQVNGTPRAPTRLLDVDLSSGVITSGLQELLELTGPSAENIRISAQKVQLLWHSRQGDKPQFLTLHKLQELHCTRVHNLDLVTMLFSCSNTLESLSLLYVNIEMSVEQLHELKLPALRRLALHERMTPSGVTMLNFFCQAANSLEFLEMCIGRGDLPAATDWLSGESPRSLKQLKLWIRVGNYEGLDRNDEQVKILWKLLDERRISREVIAHMGSGSWSL